MIMKNENTNLGHLGRHASLLGALTFAMVVSTQACGGSNSNTSLVDDGSGGSGNSGSGMGTSTGMIDLSTSDGNSSSSNGSGGGGGDDCGGVSVDAEPLAANLLFVIDRSGSMEETPEEGFDDSKWVTMVDALEVALESVPETMSVGLQFFPDAGEGGLCGMPTGSDIAVPVTPGDDGVTAVSDALNDSDNAPNGNTPAADALALALQYFTEGDGADLEGDNYVLLAIDGGPNCNGDITCGVDTCTGNIEEGNDTFEFCGDGSDENLNRLCLDDERTVNQVKALADAGITTLVVGIPGSDLDEYVAVLDQLAEEGGARAQNSSPKYYQVEDADELADTLLRLTSNLVTNCELVLDEPPPDIGEVNVFVDDEVVYKNEDGWAFDDEKNPTKIILQGEACDLVETEGVQNLTVEYGCPTYEIPK